MAIAANPTTFSDLVKKSGLIPAEKLEEFLEENDQTEPNAMASALIKAELLTAYQAKQLLAGKFRGFFLGTYKILKPLGQGGMGAVYLAEHTSLSRKVAVKVLTPDKAKDKLSLERFIREARSAAALDHPNIIRLHDISQGNGVHFIVMEYLQGNDLQSLMTQTGALHFAQAAQYIAMAAAGLQHAHDKGFIHRDIKPANLMLTKEGHIKILDMGLARSFTNSKDNITAALAEGDIAGTIDYLSPEQAVNSPLDERTDIYSLGATFYALVAGHPPFHGTTAQKLMQHQIKEPVTVNKKLNGRVPPALSDVIQKMMAKRPSERYQTAGEVIDALGPWLPAVSTGNIVQERLSESELLIGSRSRNTKAKGKGLSPDVVGGEKPLWKRPVVLIGSGVGLAVVLFAGILTALALGGNNNKSNPTTPNIAQNSNGGGGQSQQQPNGSPLGQLSNSSPLYRLDISKEAPSRTTVSTTDGGNRDLSGALLGWCHNLFKEDAVANYIVERQDGYPVIGIRAVQAGNAQWAFRPRLLRSLTLTPDKSYKVHFEYKTEGRTGGFCSIQKMGTWDILETQSIDAPNGWKTVAKTFTMPADADVQVCIGTNGDNGATVWIRRFEIEAADGVAAPSAPSSQYSIDKTLYKMDLAAVKSTSLRGTREVLSNVGRDVTLKVAEKVGPGILPTGWGAALWDDLGESEFQVDRLDNSNAFGFRNLKKNSGFLTSPDFSFAGAKIRIRFEYRVDGSDSKVAQLKFKSILSQNSKDIREIKIFGGTGGEWRTIEADFDPLEIKTGFFEYHYLELDPNRWFWFRKFEVYSLKEGNGSSAAVQPERNDGELFRLDFAGLEPQTITIGNTNLQLPRTSFPKGNWLGDSWAKGATAELKLTKDPEPSISLTPKVGEASSQVFSVDPVGSIREGNRYRFSVTYRYDGKNATLCGRPTSDTSDQFLSLSLPASGEWRTATETVVAKKDSAVHLFLQNNGGNSTLTVREITIVEVK